MPHTDEGTLHAHLDGELTVAEAAELQSHLATCVACRERLDAARRVRDRAHAILRRADPPPVVMPDFATLRARRAAAVPPAAPSRSSRGLGLAWAASVAIALGAGWFAQDLLRGGGETVAISSREAPMAEAAPDVAVSAAPPSAMSARGVAIDAVDGGAEAVAEGAPAARALQLGDAADAGLAETETDAAPAADALAKDTAVEQQRSLAAAATQGADESEQASGFAAPPPPAALRTLGAAATGSASGGWPGSDGWLVVDAAAASARLGRDLATLRDLPVTAYAMAADGSPTVRVTQRLPGGESAEVLQRAAEATGEIEIVVRAPVPADSLERLRRAVR